LETVDAVYRLATGPLSPKFFIKRCILSIIKYQSAVVSGIKMANENSKRRVLEKICQGKIGLNKIFCSGSANNHEEYRLLTHLFKKKDSDYSAKLVRPVKSHHHAINVTLGIAFIKVVNLVSTRAVRKVFRILAELFEKTFNRK